MSPNQPRTVKNMYRYVLERMKERLSDVSVNLLDCLNKAEYFKSVGEETSDEIRKLVEGLEEDFKIIHKFEKKIDKKNKE